MTDAAGPAAASATAGRGQPMIVAIVHQKGGSGKTTTACNLGIALARRLPAGQVAVVDLDPQCSASQHLSPDEDGSLGGSYELLCGTQPLSALLRPTQARRTLLVPGGPRLTLAEIDPALRDLSHLRLRRLLSEQSGDVACIILDCAPGFGGLATVAAMAADLVLVPSPPLRFSEGALAKGARFLESLRADGRERVYLLTTMADADDPVQAVTEQRLRGIWEDHVFFTRIPYDSAAERSAATGVPVVLHEPRSAMALAYRDAAKELHHLLDPTLPEDPAAGTDGGEGHGVVRRPPEPAVTAQGSGTGGGSRTGEAVHMVEELSRKRRWPWLLLFLLLAAAVAGVAALQGHLPVLAEALPPDWIVRGQALLANVEAQAAGLLRGVLGE